jgi:hypothetical protein
MRKVTITIEAETDLDVHELENASLYSNVFLRRGTFGVQSVKVAAEGPTVHHEERPASPVEPADLPVTPTVPGS